MPSLHIAFLGCGFITRVHSGHLRRLRSHISCSYASRDRGKAEQFRKRYRGQQSFASYDEAIADPSVDAVVVAVPPRFHLELTLRATVASWTRRSHSTRKRSKAHRVSAIVSGSLMVWRVSGA